MTSIHQVERPTLSIRSSSNSKDHLKGRPADFVLVEVATPQLFKHPLQFRTSHPTKPTDVDLRLFETGQLTIRAQGRLWNGPLQGRPLLIAEMAPAIEDQLSPLSEKSVHQYMQALRTWWRLFDSVDDLVPERQSLTSTAQLTGLHRQRAFDQGMDRLVFGNFLLLANKTRASLGLKPLYWQRPAPRPVNRHLPPKWQTDLVRRELKHRWFAALDRWSLAEELVQKGAPIASRETAPDEFKEQERLLQNYLRFDEVVSATGHPRPNVTQLAGDNSKEHFYDMGNMSTDMLMGRYPDSDDIRAAFHMCLATTGWNPAVFLALNVNEPFIEPHPKDPSRYVLRGVKERGGGSEQVAEGLYKTQGSAGNVLQTLIRRTAPLREHLRLEHRVRCEQLASETDPLARTKLQNSITSFEQGIRSPWLYVSKVKEGIHWLDDNSFQTSKSKLGYLKEFVVQLNHRQPRERQLSLLKASDLRDAYAAHVYHANGGSILAVMKALNHKRLSSTREYLDNTLLREEHRRLFSTFSDALWGEMASTGRVDPSVLAKMSRDGSITGEERTRLHSYRKLLRSRIGVGCKDPTNPPRHIAPDFVTDGIKSCHVQRCMLCIEHAVVFPDSLGGLCKRMAELRHIKSRMSVAAFLQSSFEEELNNTELALLAFDGAEVSKRLSDWSTRIAAGTHRVIEFDGSYEGVSR